MSDCNHVWKVPLYGPTDTIRCEKCGVNGQGYEIANNLERQLAELQELLTLIRDDLRMRSEDGVVDISDFIWMRIDKVLQEKGE